MIHPASHSISLRRGCLVCLVFALIILAQTPASASTYTTPDGELKRYNLQVDEASLLNYLQAGIPEDAPITFDRRWRLYDSVSGKLGELGASSAVPVLIGLIESASPPPLEKDLVFSAIRGPWESWDASRSQNLAEFRASCASALARIDDARALPVLIAYLTQLERLAEAEQDKERPQSSFHIAYGRVCRAITALGDRAGIDAMVAMLDRLPREAPESIVWHLQLCTGQPYGPKYSLPQHRWAEETAKWEAWWRANRATFQIDRAFVVSARKPNLTRPNPQTLREHLAAAETRHMDYDGTGYGKHSAEWLEGHCGALTAELATVVADRNEDGFVRREALTWLVSAQDPRNNGNSDDSALAVLTQCALGDQAYVEEHGERLLIQMEALKLIVEHYPQAADDVAKHCMRDEMVSSNAVHQLMKNDENDAYVAVHFDEIDPGGQSQALQFFLRRSEPVGQSAFFAGLSSPHAHDVLYSVLGIEKFDLEKNLPPERQEVFDKWRADPLIRLLTLERAETVDDRGPTVMEVLNGIEGTDHTAAELYRRAWYLLPEGERAVAMSGLERCVAVYMESRGL